MKQVLKTLGPVITHIINLSLGSATFPPKWKISRILPLLKSSDAPKEVPASYRPVAQLPLVAKLTERIVQKQLLEYLENSNLLAPDHHAYRRRHSTTTALVQLMDTISTAADANQITATLSMDLSAAFDCVDHGILLDKLGYYGLDSQTLSWIKSYLQYRSFYVSIGSAKSEYRNSSQGVPQGSVMGPMMYLLYVNELPSIVEDEDCSDPSHRKSELLFPTGCKSCGSLPVYADDGTYAITSNNRSWNQRKIENCFWKTKNFLNANKLQVNDTKTNLTEFMLHQKRAKLTGIPPDLTVRETITDRNGTEREGDKLISDKTVCRLLGMN